MFCTKSFDDKNDLSTERRELSGKELREIKAMEVLHNLTDNEKLRLERLKTEYATWKAELREVSNCASKQWITKDKRLNK